MYELFGRKPRTKEKWLTDENDGGLKLTGNGKQSLDKLFTLSNLGGGEGEGGQNEIHVIHAIVSKCKHVEVYYS